MAASQTHTTDDGAGLPWQKLGPGWWWWWRRSWHRRLTRAPQAGRRRRTHSVDCGWCRRQTSQVWCWWWRGWSYSSSAQQGMNLSAVHWRARFSLLSCSSRHKKDVEAPAFFTPKFFSNKSTLFEPRNIKLKYFWFRLRIPPVIQLLSHCTVTKIIWTSV